MTNHAFYKQCLWICARGFTNFHSSQEWFKKHRARIHSLPIRKAAEILFAFRQAEPKCFRSKSRAEHAP